MVPGPEGITIYLMVDAGYGFGWEEFIYKQKISFKLVATIYRYIYTCQTQM